MAEYGEWNRKGATLSDVTATKEYGVSQAFIVRGIRAGKLEYREGAIWGNPYLRVLRRQLEQYVAQDKKGNGQPEKETGRTSDSKERNRESQQEVADRAGGRKRMRQSAPRLTLSVSPCEKGIRCR